MVPTGQNQRRRYIWSSSIGGCTGGGGEVAVHDCRVLCAWNVNLSVTFARHILVRGHVYLLCLEGRKAWVDIEAARIALILSAPAPAGSRGPAPTQKNCPPLGGAVARVSPNISLAMCPLKTLFGLLPARLWRRYCILLSVYTCSCVIMLHLIRWCLYFLSSLLSEGITTHADGSRGGTGFHCPVIVCLSVFPHDISKPDAAKTTKLDIQMFHDESWKLIYFGIKRSKVKVRVI